MQATAGAALGDVNPFDYSLEDFFRLWARVRLDPVDERTGERADHLPDAVGFAVHPGRYCEAATFGLAWVPPEDGEGDRLRGEPCAWHWHCVCKTQYASVVSDEHLIHCHTTLVAQLEETIRLGFAAGCTGMSALVKPRSMKAAKSERGTGPRKRTEPMR